MATQRRSTNPPAGQPPGTVSTGTGRKPWKKKSVGETIAAQRDRLNEQVREKEAELKELKEQLSKFDEVLKVFQK